MYSKRQPEIGPNDSGTQIRITFGTRGRLVEIGKKNESYDACINRLIDENRKMGKLLYGKLSGE